MAHKETVGSRIRLTEQTVEAALKALQAGPKKTRLWDLEEPAFFLQITNRGAASYCVRYSKPSGGRSDFTICRANLLPVKKAREAARAKLAQLAVNGVDPVEARQTAKAQAKSRKLRTFKALAESYLAAPRSRPQSERTASELEWRLNKHTLPKLSERPFDELRRRDIRECIREIWKDAGGNGKDRAGNRIANMCHGDIKAVFSWAMDEDLVDANPAAFRKMFDDTPVKRRGKLTDETLKTIWTALDEEQSQGWGEISIIAIQLCFVTLQRPNEIVKAHRDDFHFKDSVWRIHPDRNKTDQWYEVPLSELAVQLFTKAFKRHNSKWAFPAKNGKDHIRSTTLSHRFEKTRKRLVDAKDLASADVQLYDARRFGRTRIEETLGFSEQVAEKVINHTEDRAHRRRYFIGDISGEVRRAQEAWTGELRRIVYGEAVEAKPTKADAELEAAARV